MDGLVDWLLVKVREPSTWAGVAVIVTSVVDVNATQVQIEQFSGYIAGAVGIALVWITEKYRGNKSE